MNKKYMVNLHVIVARYSFYHLCINIKNNIKNIK